LKMRCVGAEVVAEAEAETPDGNSRKDADETAAAAEPAERELGSATSGGRAMAASG